MKASDLKGAHKALADAQNAIQQLAYWYSLELPIDVHTHLLDWEPATRKLLSALIDHANELGRRPACCWCEDPATERLGAQRDLACQHHAQMYRDTYTAPDGEFLRRAMIGK